MQHIVIDPAGALPSALQAFVVPDERKAIGLAIEALIVRLDERDGDPDLEDVDEREPDHDDERAAWIERVDQSTSPYIVIGSADYLNHEDVEDDDGSGEASEDDPAFDPAAKLTANALAFVLGRGPGCPISDPSEEDDHSGEYANEDQPGDHTTGALFAAGPGCPIGDPGGTDLDAGEAGDCHGAYC